MNSTFKTLTFLASSSLVLGLTMGSGIAEAASVVATTIDPFSNSQTVNRNSVGTSLATPVSFTSSLLGAVTRNMSLNVTASNGQFADVSIPVGGGQNGLSISNGTNVKSNTTLTYGFSGPIDFTSNGADRFLFNIFVSDFPGSIDVTVNGQTRNIAYPGLADNQPLELFYSAFSTNLAAVNSFSVKVNTPGGSSGLADVTLGFFSTGKEMPTNVPEPSALIGLGLIAGLGTLAKRKQK